LSTLQLTQLLNWKELRRGCSRAGCHTLTLRYPLLTRKTGVRVGTEWYCSPECLREGLELRICELQRPSNDPPARRDARIPLGLLLVSRGCITQLQWQRAQDVQRERGGEIGDILCNLNFATERQVAEASATQWGCPVFTAKPQLAEIQARVPATLMKLINMAPVHYAPASNRLLVGFVYHVQHRVLRTIEDMTSCVAEPCFITATDCCDTIRSLNGLHVEVSFESPLSTSEIANIIQSYADQIGADEARLALCEDYLWVRLNRDGHPTDLLFDIRGRARKTSLIDYLDITS